MVAHLAGELNPPPAVDRANSDSLLRNHVLPHFGALRLGSTTQTDVQGFVARLKEKGLSASTIRQAYLPVAGLLSSALNSDLVARTPPVATSSCHRTPDTRTEMRFLTTGEVADVADAIDVPCRTLVLTAAYTGCRFGELAGLRALHLDLFGPEPCSR
jgi:integrase